MGAGTESPLLAADSQSAMQLVYVLHPRQDLGTYREELQRLVLGN